MVDRDKEIWESIEKKQDLDTQRRKALNSGDYLKYSVYNACLGIDPEQTSAHSQGVEDGLHDEERVKELEKEIYETLYGKEYMNQKIAKKNLENKTASEISSIDIKKYENMGIKESQLFKLSYRTLNRAWYGLNNFNCPELYKNMNPAEIIGLLAGIGPKEDAFQKIIHAERSENDTLADIVSNIISKTVSRGYHISSNTINYDKKHKTRDIDLDIFAKTSKEPYSAKYGEMKERIKALPAATIEKIYEQLIQAPKQYLVDPNIDARHAPKRPYTSGIITHVTTAYKILANK